VGIIVELLVQVFFEFLICSAGAFVIQAFGGFRRSYADVRKGSELIQFLAGIAFWIVAIFAIVVVVKLLQG
jgi:hypothetical protein